MPDQTSRERYSLYVLAIALLVIGIAAQAPVFRHSALSSMGILTILASVGLFRMSGVRPNTHAELADRAEPRVTWRAWLVLAAAFVAVALSWYAMRVDAEHGGAQAWPAYAFFAAILVSGITGGYVVMRLSRL